MRILVFTSLLCATSLAASASVSAGTLYVAHNGVDGSRCGATAGPCRSISQAILNALAGDTVFVRPGRYGDINGDGNVDPGDENYSNRSQRCLVCIDKPLRVRSTHGAGVTTIDGGKGTTASVVEITASDVTFGSPGNGFTVRNGVVNGISVFSQVTPHNVSISNNILEQDGQSGMFVGGGTSISVEGNTALHNEDGFTLDLGADSVVRGNTSAYNRLGFNLGGDRVRMTENVVDGNNQGIFIHGTSLIFERNTVTNSGIDGVVVSDGTLSSFVGNSVIGNQGPGVTLFNGTRVTRFTSNNIFDNGTSAISFTGEPPNCGLYNGSRSAIQAPNNFWGAASGPGVDPADAVCNLQSTTVVAPVASGALVIVP